MVFMVFFHKAAVALLLSLILMLSFSACAETQSNEIEPQSSSQSEPAFSGSTEKQYKKSALVTFLENYSEEDMEDLFMTISAAALPNMADSKDPFPYYGFKNTSELSSNGLYNFFCTFCDQTKLEEYWNEQDQKYHIPIHFVRSTLDQYFEGYQFIPEDINLQIFNYDKDKQVFVAPAAIGFDCRKDSVKFLSVEQTIERDICIRAKTLNLDIPNKETGATEILVMHPKNNKFFFQSYQIIPRTYTDRELYDFSDSLGFKIEHWVGQRPLSSAILYDRFVELLCKFDQNNYGYLQIAVDDGSDDFKPPDWQYEYRKVVDIKSQPVEISYDQPGSVHAQWTKNGYVYSLSMNHGVKEMPIDQFIKDHVGSFIENLVISPEHAG